MFLLPPTNENHSLYHQCGEKRKNIGDNRYHKHKDLKESKLTFTAVGITALCRAFEIIISEPLPLALNSYDALCYDVFYPLFDAFPIALDSVYYLTTIY